jgi:hypothetical protein
VRDQEFLERRIYEQRVRLYMVAGIDESVEFLTQTKKEIGVSILIVNLYSLGHQMAFPELYTRIFEKQCSIR